MSDTYKSRYGFDWPASIPDEFIGLIIGKKWREFAKQGYEFKDPWEPMLASAKALFPADKFKVSSWTEQHFHDWVMEPKLVIWGCAASSKSNDTGALLVLDWVVDPDDTVTLLGSTTKEDLKKRSWEAVVRYHNLLKQSKKFVVPGVIPSRSQSLINVRGGNTDASDMSSTEKAGIHGQALNEDGRMQGAHAKYVRVVVDELAEIKDLEPINTALINLKIGADLKFVGLANPASWENPSCQYCIPENGISSVDTDTGCWRSTRGVFVRHHDGFKSPCVLHPELRDEFPFLITQDDIDENLRLVDGNMDAPKVWQMVRGFPPPSDAEIPVVLDAKIAREQKVTDPPKPSTVVACAAGIDPAWSEGGDGAIDQIVKIRQVPGFYPILDFTDIFRLKILASSPDPVTKQLRDQVVALMRNPGTYTPSLTATAVDSSANQGLADDLDIYVGAGATSCLHVNFSQRASEEIFRANSDIQARERFRDRATEAWCILAEYCKAGMVCGLSTEVVRALTTRRFATLPNSKTQKFPLQLESKDEFKKRFKKSPDEADAAALAALAVKERLGILPYGWMAPASKQVIDPAENTQNFAPLPTSTVFEEGTSGHDALDDLG